MTFRGFHSRSDLGLAPALSRSTNITPTGLTKHYGGSALGIPLELSGHAACIRTWQAWQRFHMGTRDWADIAYSVGFCQHGYLLAGRGRGIRTAANGTNTGNQLSHAACFIEGGNTIPTVDALDALDTAWGTFGGGHFRSHSSWKSTACAGRFLNAYQVGERTGRLPEVPDAPKPSKPSQPKKPTTPSKEFAVPTFPNVSYDDRGEYVGRLQGLLLAWGYRTFTGDRPDKHWGPRMEAAMLAFCRERKIVSAGYSGRIVAGPNVAARLVTG